MKRFKRSMALAFVLVFALSLFATPIMAAGQGTLTDPFIGGNDFKDTFTGRIVLHKLDVTPFVEKLEKALKEAGTLAADGEVKYKPAELPTGAEIAPGQQVGTYTTSEDGHVAETAVKVEDLTGLGNITFQIEQVKLDTGKTAGSHVPSDYVPTGTIDSYAKTDSTGTIDWTGLPEGYYRISEVANDTAAPFDPAKTSFIISMPMVNPDKPSETMKTIHMYPKNKTSGPKIVKEQPDVDDFNGNILSWTIKADIPATIKPDVGKQKYVITDTMGAGLQYAGKLKVYYLENGAEKVLSTTTPKHYSVVATTGGQSLVITLEADGFKALADAIQAKAIDTDANGKYILYVTYDTVVDIDETRLKEATDRENKVKLEFDNHEGSSYTDEPSVVQEEFASLKLIKQDGSDNSIRLNDVEFKIYTKLKAGDTEIDEDSALKDAKGQDIVFITKNDGTFFYGGLAAGTYYIKELAPPAGYKALDKFETLVIDEADVKANVNTIKTVTINKYHNNTFTLPSTGGAGTVLFVIIGIALIGAAAAVFMISKRRASRKN